MTDARSTDRADSLAALLDERNHLLRIATWMFDSADIAENIVRRTHQRWFSLSGDERTAIASPRAWLTRTAADVCLELLADAKVEDARPVSGNPPKLLDHVDLAGCARRSLRPEHARATRQFATACQAGDAAALHDLLASDVIVVTDGGGQLRIPARPVRGRADVAQFVATLLGGQANGQLAVEQVNGAPGIVLRRAGDARAVVSLTVTDAKVAVVWIVVNPDKLRAWRRGLGSSHADRVDAPVSNGDRLRPRPR
jgi:RNA polymerase sigma-70 factor, ECF subfamily